MTTAAPAAPAASATATTARGPEATRSWIKQRSILRELRFEAKQIMILKAIEELNVGDSRAQHNLDSMLFGVSKSSAPEDTLTSHEKVLDNWRIVVTIALIIVLFGVIAMVVLIKSATSAGTPYVSLISGLAGIALGWMFANAGAQSGKTRSQLPESTNPTGTSPVARKIGSGTLPEKVPGGTK